MAEEFQESEVIFSDQSFTSTEEDSLFGYRENLDEIEVGNRNSKRMKTNELKRRDGHCSKSLPVDVPDNRFRKYVENPREMLSGEEYSGDGEIVPPHVIVGRRTERQSAFSLCSGNGRIKGRDLNRIRNSVLRMTGFLEA